MLTIEHDEEVEGLHPRTSLEDLAQLLSLLCGEPIALPEGSEERQPRWHAARLAALREVFKKSPERLTFEQLNELLLLLGQDRASEAFFGFFFLEKIGPQLAHAMPLEEVNEKQPAEDTPSITWQDLKEGVTKFRAFALLCFGNFRFAFKRLSRLQTRGDLVGKLDRWAADGNTLLEDYESRCDPIVKIKAKISPIPRDQTWKLGYISRAAIYRDAARVFVIDGKLAGESLSQTISRISRVSIPEVAQAVQEYWDRLPDSFVKKWGQSLATLQSRLQTLMEEFESAVIQGTLNTVKYLTWDFLDIYFATSMRNQWDFTDAHDSIKAIWRNRSANLGKLKLRWFDPTQSYEGSVIDKGLVEGLMLKRASLTIYMAQEGETLGKDSELAATLAQGKPVIAYVPEYKTAKALEGLARELYRRPVEYFRKRLRTLDAAGFFERDDNLMSACKRLKTMEGQVPSESKFWHDIVSGWIMVEDFAPDFSFVSLEEEEYRKQYRQEFLKLSKRMAAIESVEADNRARTLQSKHPLAFQVHLETGVANGVLVARSPRQCAELVRRFLLNELVFRIRPLKNEEDPTQPLGTVLEEASTGSRFRVVTANEVLTNSFWNFYGADRH